MRARVLELGQQLAHERPAAASGSRPDRAHHRGDDASGDARVRTWLGT
jgi:hypothetical protein